MQRRILAVVGAAGVLLLAWASRRPVVQPAGPSPVQQRQAVVQTVDRPPAAAIPAPRPPLAEPGGIDREVQARHPPLDNTRAWQDRRAEASRRIHQQQLAATQSFAENTGLSAEDSAEIVAAIDDLHQQLQTLKAQVEQGQIAPSVLRAQSPVLREAAEVRIEAVIGEAQMQALRARLAERLGGGF